VWLALEEELVGGSGGEEGENIRDGDLQEDDVYNLSICQTSDSPVLEDVVGFPGSEAEPKEEEGGEAGDGTEGNGDHEENREDPSFGVLGGDCVIISY